MRAYQICTKCIMDTTDPEIVFDHDGVCNHCRQYEARSTAQHPNLSESKEDRLRTILTEMKKEGRNKEYDCVAGISGGVDSCYVVYLLKKHGLNPLAVHFDSGWNSELAVNNIENILKKLDVDLHTFVVNWEEMRDLQLSFFKSSVPNQDIPTDHAILATLFMTAKKHHIKYIVSGSNMASESILPKAWGYASKDLRHIKAIQRRFGSLKLKQYPTLGIAKEVFSRMIRRTKIVNFLDHIDYIKADAKKLLTDELDWRDYGGKHYESVFTRFFQSYYLPIKFGYDKRRAHLSSLIVSGQMLRDDALIEMENPTDTAENLKQGKIFVAKKLGLSEEEFDKIITQPPRRHLDYPSQAWFFERLQLFSRLFLGLIGRKI